jgi:HEAT repeat protein
MLAPLLAALLALAPQTPDKPPSPEQARVQASLTQLETAFKSGSKATERITALQGAAGVADARVIALVAKGLTDREPAVELAAIDALGKTRHADALTALTGFYNKEKKNLRRDVEALPRLLTAIARHASVETLPIFLDDVQGQLQSKTVTARILGLANIRSNRSIDALFELMKSMGFIEQHTYAEDLRLALMVLTGEDQGRSVDAWQTWWNEHAKTFKVAPEMPKLPKAERSRWCAYWGLPLDKDADSK